MDSLLSATAYLAELTEESIAQSADLIHNQEADAVNQHIAKPSIRIQNNVAHCAICGFLFVCSNTLLIVCLISLNKRNAPSSESDTSPPAAKRRKQHTLSPSTILSSDSSSSSNSSPSKETLQAVKDYQRIYGTLLAIHKSNIAAKSNKALKANKSPADVAALITRSFKFCDLKFLAAANGISKRSTSPSIDQSVQTPNDIKIKVNIRIPLLSKGELGMRLYEMMDQLIEPDRYAAEKIRVATPVYNRSCYTSTPQHILQANSRLPNQPTSQAESIQPSHKNRSSNSPATGDITHSELNNSHITQLKDQTIIQSIVSMQ